MSAAWDDEYLTVQENADRPKLNQQTVRNWIDLGRLPRPHWPARPRPPIGS
jgi:hypothetical protein